MFGLDLPLGVLSRVEKIGSATSRGDASYGLICKVLSDTKINNSIYVYLIMHIKNVLICLVMNFWLKVRI